MRRIGLALITLSFLAGAYLSVLDAEEVAWPAMIVALAVGFAGVVAVQWARREAAQAPELLAENVAVLEESLDRIVATSTRLDAEKHRTDTYAVHGLIDELLLEDLDAFANARETISHLYGLPAYADIMNHFAAGERYLNRVWSASADGYIDEVHAYLERSRDQFVVARSKLAALRAGA